MSYGKQGYEAGKGRTYTPSVTDDWIDAFNKLLEQSGVSRNKLTSELIADGLKYRKMTKGIDKYISINCEGFSDEQIRLLQSEQGQIMVANMLKMLLGQQSIPSVPVFTEQTAPKIVPGESEEKEEKSQKSVVPPTTDEPTTVHTTEEKPSSPVTQNPALAKALAMKRKVEFKS